MRNRITPARRVAATLVGIFLYWLIGTFVRIPTANQHAEVMLRYPVLTMYAAFLGPVPGFIIGGAGQMCFDLTAFGILKLPTVIGSALLGLIIGIRRPDRPLKYTIDCLIANAIVWACIVPALDMLIRRFTFREAYGAGLLHALINGLTCVVVGQVVAGSVEKTLFRKIVSVIIIFDALLLFTYGRRSMGNLVVYAAAVVLCLYAAFADIIAKATKSGWRFALRMGVCILIALYALFAAFLFLDGKIMSVPENADAIIVLGAGLDGEEPNTILRERLELAEKYASEHPGIPVIVSGGQGSDEVISEAEAMKRYLVRNGLDESRIIMEPDSSTTQENFAYSKKLITDADSIIYITSEYHCFRAGFYAKMAGFENIGCIGSSTSFWSLIPALVREVPAVGKLVLKSLF